MKAHHILGRRPMLVAGLMLLVLSLTNCMSGRSKGDRTVNDGNPGGADRTPTPGQACRVIGRVADSSGRPIANARVMVPRASVPVPEIILLTHADGAYEWALPPGEFTIAVYSDRYIPQEAKVTLKAGETVSVNFTLQRQK